ncbi:hypothetical protein WN943_029622 [Citrus x changshan-huyou]
MIQAAKITNSEDTALHIAVSDGRSDIVLKLVESMGQNASNVLKLQNEKGNTALHLAAALGNAAFVKIGCLDIQRKFCHKGDKSLRSLAFKWDHCDPSSLSWELSWCAFSHILTTIQGAIGEKPMEITDDKWNEVDGNAISDLHLALADGVLSIVAEKNTAKEIWDTLTKLYEAKSLHNKIFLKRKLYTLRMDESTMVIDHINTLKTLFSQLTMLGYNIEENERAELLLQSLLDSYDQLIINLTNNNPVDSLVFDDVAASILNEQSRRKNKENKQASSQQAEALLVTRGRSIERGLSGSQSHASTSDDGEILYSEETTVSKGRKRLSDVWLIDSGATWHMTSRREWFHTYEPISRGSVYMGDDHTLEIAGIGTIKIKMFDGIISTIGEVRHVNGLKKNLLSLGQMDSHGYKTHVENGIMKIVKEALVLMKAEKISANLFMLKGETLQEADAYVASNGEEPTMMWHLKLSHMSEQGLKILSERKLLPGLKLVSLPFCEHCVISKQHR